MSSGIDCPGLNASSNWSRSRVTSNAELFEDGLLVTGIGMGVTVGVLVLLMFTIHALGLFDRLLQRRQSAVAVAEGPAGAPAADETPKAAAAGGEIVAVIAAALALAEDDESRTSPGFAGTPSPTSPDAWAAAGRRQLMDRRGRPSR